PLRPQHLRRPGPISIATKAATAEQKHKSRSLRSNRLINSHPVTRRCNALSPKKLEWFLLSQTEFHRPSMPLHARGAEVLASMLSIRVCSFGICPKQRDASAQSGRVSLGVGTTHGVELGGYSFDPTGAFARCLFGTGEFDDSAQVKTFCLHE